MKEGCGGSSCKRKGCPVGSSGTPAKKLKSGANLFLSLVA